MEPVFKNQSEAHMSAWAKRFFYDKLTAQGFVSYQDKGLSWYKVIDNSIIQTVYLFSNSYLMLMPVLGYGCHPLFITAPLPHKVRESVSTAGNVQSSILLFPTPKVMYADCPVMYTKSPEGGAELLDEIVFPHFTKLRTEADAYRFHREQIRTHMDRFLSTRSWADFNGMVACRDFMDELIYMEDWEMLKYVDRDLSPSFCRNEKERKRVDEQRAAIRDGKRDDFLIMLQKRKKRFVNRLEKNVGIHVGL